MKTSMLIAGEQLAVSAADVLCQEQPVRWVHASPYSGLKSGHRQNYILLLFSSYCVWRCSTVDSSCMEPTLTQSLLHLQSIGRTLRAKSYWACLLYWPVFGCTSFCGRKVCPVVLCGKCSVFAFVSTSVICLHPVWERTLLSFADTKRSILLSYRKVQLPHICMQFL
jgi:hypothetical protein